MSHNDAFKPNERGLNLALNRMLDAGGAFDDAARLPQHMPQSGLGADQALRDLAPRMLENACDLGASDAFAHMDPPTPWITWAISLWAASKNQNLLHPATSPEARDMEHRVISWLAPLYGMQGGHMTPGSTLANLTALWAARDAGKVRRVIASEAAHLSIRKAADILGLEYKNLATQKDGTMDSSNLPKDLSDVCLVLTAGTTSTGSIDALVPGAAAAWVHVDAAWAGPLRLSERHSGLLDGIEQADSIAISAHKWLFQPKESALVLFKDEAISHGAMSYGGSYLTVPNVGLLGSHGATAAPLLATFLAYGQTGVAAWIDCAMDNATQLADALSDRPEFVLWARPVTGVVNWNLKNADLAQPFYDLLPNGSTSQTTIDGKIWFRNVAANPNVDMSALIAGIDKALEAL